MSFDFKTATPANFAAGNLLFGTVSQVAATPSIFTAAGLVTFFQGAITSLANLTVVGTIATGVWNATPITPQYGGTGLATITNHSVLLGAGTGNINPLAVPASGTILQGVAASDPVWTATPTLGVAGTTVGTLAFANATSGSITISPPTGALGAFTAFFPTLAGNSTFALLEQVQTFTGLNTFNVGVTGASNVFWVVNSSSPQSLRVFATRTDVNNGAWLEATVGVTANTVIFGSNSNGTGAGNLTKLRFNVDGVSKADYGITTSGWTLTTSLAVTNVTVTGFLTTTTFFQTSGAGFYGFNGGSRVYGPVNSNLQLANNANTDFNLLQFGGTTSSFPALKKSSTTIQSRLADDSAFGSLQGKLTTDTAYTATPQVCTGYITIYDSTGTPYKVMVAP